MREEASQMGAERTQALEEFQVSTADINRLIKQFKDDRGIRMKELGIPLKDYEFLVDTWYQAVPTADARTDYLVAQKESFSRRQKELNDAIKAAFD